MCPPGLISSLLAQSVEQSHDWSDSGWRVVGRDAEKLERGSSSALMSRGD